LFLLVVLSALSFLQAEGNRDFLGREGSDTLVQELLVDPWSGSIHPEYGPNMMWNLSSSHMMGGWYRNSSGPMALTEEDAVEKANYFLSSVMPGSYAGNNPDKFNGYYTSHVFRDENITGMLSVNGFSGQVWYHNWHGIFIGMTEEHD